MFEETSVLLMSSLRTHQQVQRWFRENGVTVADWSLKNGFNPALVYAVLQGKRKCLRGESHKIAVALSLKIPTTDV